MAKKDVKEKVKETLADAVLGGMPYFGGFYQGGKLLLKGTDAYLKNRNKPENRAKRAVKAAAKEVGGSTKYASKRKKKELRGTVGEQEVKNVKSRGQRMKEELEFMKEK